MVLQLIGAAYQHLREVDVFGTVMEGKELFDAAVNAYYTKIEKVEGDLEAKIRESLEKAEDANEMFRICARFNALFIRPRIAAAVHDYQEQLIATVKKDISVRRTTHLLLALPCPALYSRAFCLVLPCSNCKTSSVASMWRVRRANSVNCTTCRLCLAPSFGRSRSSANSICT
jgi:hypothetical protein